MDAITVRDMQAEDEYFVHTCSHVNQSAETDACGVKRGAWLRNRVVHGARSKVALIDGRHVGFVFVLPIELSPCGPVGRDLSVLPCLWVLPKEKGQGVGRALLAAAEQETQRQNRKALCTTAMTGDFWFMPASFFERHGYAVVAEHDKTRLLWKVFDSSAEKPSLLRPRYEYRPVAGKVVVDLFCNPFCATTVVEAQRVRDVAAEFGDAVVVRETSSDDRDAFLCHQIVRAIYVNGKEIGWGYEAPRDGIREAISKAQALCSGNAQ
ncbi:MAG TPA: GNAT family N-acetyltransferase [Phycisphaerae bacterium]|nr:GNAT family N-acetyltransferase [Phycisphaerae bacterium]